MSPRTHSARLAGLASTLDRSAAQAPFAAARLQVRQRQAMRSSIATGARYMAVSSPLFGVALAIIYPREATPTALVYGGLTVLAIGIWILVRGRGRRHPEGVGLLLAVGVVGATATLMAAAPDTHPVMVATFTLVPIGVAVFIPWRLRTHLGWLALSFAMLFLAVLAPTMSGSPAEHWEDAVVGFSMSALVSVVAALLLKQQRHSAFASERRASDLAVQASRQSAQLEELNRYLAISVRTDPLTRSGNRLRLDEDLEVLRARLSRHGRGFGLAMIDLDRFKAFNDRYGHVRGDEVLRAVAGCLGQRSDDAAYRFGGEEFVIVFAEADEVATQAATNRVLRAVEALAIPHAANLPWGLVTASAGTVTIAKGDSGNPDDWLRAVDAALYRAKAAGRNCLEAAPMHRAERAAPALRSRRHAA